MLEQMVELRRDGPLEARDCVVLAHGAGAGMDSAFMQAVAEGLALRGIGVLRFEFPYMRERRAGVGKRGPDRAEVLCACWKQVLEELGGASRYVIGGKSMGGRIASMIADEVGARGVLCFGYPFHPTGKPKVLRTAHLAQLRTPTLIVQGTRDSMGSRDEVAGYALSEAIRVAWIEDGDHSLAPRKRSGQSATEALASALDLAAAFVRQS
jgi:predicted alpha/beta-hydrolase family hydrolase